MTTTADMQPTTKENDKKRVLNDNEYNKLSEFVNNFHGLAIDCEMELKDNFPQIQRLTLKAILDTEMSNRFRTHNWRYDANATKYLAKLVFKILTYILCKCEICM